MAQSLIDSGQLDPFDTARALDLEGICYEDMGEPEKAIHVLEAAQQLLGPNNNDELVAVLDNVGRIYAGSGDMKTATHLYARAFRIAEKLGNHCAMARVANNQAAIALKKGNNHEARKYLRRIDQEVKQAPALNSDALASIASMKGWLALNEGDTREALSEYEAALRLWTAFHGERHPLTAWGRLLVGEAQSKTGDLGRSVQNMRDGLAMLASTLGENNHRRASGLRSSPVN
jgi:tetratricopeptide (TPR) repeat protein